MEILNFNQFNEGLKVKLKGPKNFGHERVFAKRSNSGDILNKDKIKKIVKKVVKHLGYDDGKVIYKGSGSFGSAFSIDGKAIKFTSDESEASIAWEMKKITKNNCPDYIIKYYDVLRLKSKKLDNDIFVIIMDEVELPNYADGEDNETFFDDLCGYVESEDGYTPDESDFEGLNREYGYSVKNIEKWYDDLMKGKEFLYKKGITSVDYHSNNIGFKKGHLVHFDLRSGSITDTDEKTLKKLEEVIA